MSAQEEEEEPEVIVLDGGSGSMKAGFSGEDAPRSVFPNVVGQSRDAKRRRAGDTRDTVVGQQAQDKREMLALRYPVERGQVTRWDDMERVWEWALHEELEVDPEAMTYPILLTEMPLVSRADRERAAEIMFSKFHVPAYYAMNSCALALFASGRTRGLVVEAGAGVTHCCPVFEGYPLPHATLRLGVAGQDVTARLRDLLVSSGVVGADVPLAAVEQIKETMGHVAPAGGGAARSGSDAYELPDGAVVRVPTATCAQAAEVLFDPAAGGEGHTERMRGEAEKLGATLLAHSSFSGVCRAAAEAVAMCDHDLQVDLLQSVVVAGGTSMLPGFADRVADELSALAPGPSRVNVYPDSQRKHAAWIGGSMLGSLPTFNQIKVTRQEYEEDPSVVHRKLF